MKIEPEKKSAASAFTLIELLVVIAIIGILAGMLLPVLARGKGSAQRIACVNNLRQLGLSMQLYEDDHDGLQPIRTINVYGGAWPNSLRPYYQDFKILTCPSDVNPLSNSSANSNADRAPRSYMVNGWNDYFDAQGIDFNHLEGLRMPESAIRETSDTIVFGEKLTNSIHFYMDFMEVDPATLTSNDFDQLDHNKHLHTTGDSGGSNYAFADGSARYVKYWASINPVNMWGVTEQWRHATF